MGLLIFGPGKHEHHYSFLEHLERYPLAVFMTSSFFLFIRERDHFYAVQSEGAIYLYTLTFFYYISPLETYHLILGAIGIGPALFAIYCAFSSKALSAASRFWLSIWVLLLTLIYCSTQLIAGSIDLATISVRPTGFITAVAYWAGFTLLAACGIYLFGAVMALISLLPTKGKNETALAVQRRKEENQKFVESRILSEQTPVKVILFISIVHGVPLLMNWYYLFLPHSMAVSYAMIVSPPLTYGLSRLFLRS
jgi:hypothetical protein